MEAKARYDPDMASREILAMCQARAFNGSNLQVSKFRMYSTHVTREALKLLCLNLGFNCLLYVLFVWGFMARSTFFCNKEPRQKPVEGIALLLLAKLGKGSLKYFSS